MLDVFKQIFGTSTDYKALVEAGALIVDVRTPQEFQAGHIKGSQNLPLGEFDRHIAKLQKAGKPIITCCASGMRSGSAAGKLKAAGVEAYNGGGWQSLNQAIK
ncbi:MAG: rhodanese-like domain-containing protein [Phaeodactylibacter sp.]|nr:rhodanese-like domain-containing protein [Phaeodactylibacter sp.]